MIAELLFFAASTTANPCANSNDSAFDWRECMVEYNEKLELELQQVWRKAVQAAQQEDFERTSSNLHRDKRGQSQRLTDSQLNWNRYRKQQCDAESYRMFGGTGVIGLELSCFVRMNRQRVIELRSFVETK